MRRVKRWNFVAKQEFLRAFPLSHGKCQGYEPYEQPVNHSTSKSRVSEHIATTVKSEAGSDDNEPLSLREESKLNKSSLPDLSKEI